jgi:hypothetical protein
MAFLYLNGLSMLIILVSAKEIILMTVASQVKQTLATLRSAGATLRIYATQSQAEDAKAVFMEATAALGEINQEIEERLKTLEFQEPQYKGL